MRNVVFVAPFLLPTTMKFARAAARLGDARLLGIVQQPPGGEDAKVFADVVRVGDGLDTGQLIEAARVLQRRHGEIQRVLGVLEPLQVQLAEVRRALGVPGTPPETADLFRNKARMKDELRRHGLPCARHRVIGALSDFESFAAEVGYPIVLKPQAGLGARGTFRIRSLDEARGALGALHARPEQPALAEEFLRGREYSFETITIAGEPRFHSITRYYPAPLEVVENPWIQWVVVLPRVIETEEFAGVREMGVRAIKALGLETGFTHMEWVRRDDGSLAIGEIAARPPGAHIVLANCYAHDADLYFAWARAVADGAFDGPWERRYAVGTAFLRGMGHGRVVRVTGAERAQELIGRHVVEARLPSPGEPRSESYEGDGHVIVRDPDTEVVKAAMKTVIETIRIEYG
jgi:biotin carboxylase